MQGTEATSEEEQHPVSLAESIDLVGSQGIVADLPTEQSHPHRCAGRRRRALQRLLHRDWIVGLDVQVIIGNGKPGGTLGQMSVWSRPARAVGLADNADDDEFRGLDRLQ